MPKVYDSQKAHDYYERTKHLKGRKPGAGDKPTGPRPSARQVQAANAKVAQIQAKLSRLRDLLHEKQAAARKEADHKPTQAEKLKDQQQSKEYYDKHKQSIKNLRKGSGGGSDKGASKPKTAADMSVDELKTAIRNVVTQLKQAITEARSMRGG